jgi:hypothetical protein
VTDALPPKAPRKRGVDPYVYEQALADYRAAMRAFNAARAKSERERLALLPVDRFEWLSADPGGCEVAARNGGKKFKLATPPRDGYPAEGRCTAPDWCRCRMIPVVRF